MINIQNLNPTINTLIPQRFSANEMMALPTPNLQALLQTIRVTGSMLPPLTSANVAIDSTQDKDTAKAQSQVSYTYSHNACGIESAFVLAQACGAYRRGCDNFQALTAAEPYRSIGHALRPRTPPISDTELQQAFKTMVTRIRETTTLLCPGKLPIAMECWEVVAGTIPQFTFTTANITYCCRASAGPPIRRSYIPLIPEQAGCTTGGLQTIADVCSRFFSPRQNHVRCESCGEPRLQQHIVLDRLPLHLMVEWATEFGPHQRTLTDVVSETDFLYMTREGAMESAGYKHSRGAILGGERNGFGHLEGLVMLGGLDRPMYIKDAWVAGSKGSRKRVVPPSTVTGGIVAVMLRREI